MMQSYRRKTICLLWAALAFIGGLFGTACLSTTENEPDAETMNHVQNISAKDARAIMYEENVVLLDVRTLEEYESGHIEDAVLLPVDEIEESSASEAIPDKSAQVIVYCRSGVRSADASKKLVTLGYEKVYDLGGIQSWPYDVKKGAEDPNKETASFETETPTGPIPGACGTR